MSRSRYLLVFVAALLSNIIGCRFGYAVAHRQMAVAMGLGMLLPMMQAVNSALFIAAENRAQRVQIAATNGLATACAGGFVTFFLTS
jgi:hypothetical protein